MSVYIHNFALINALGNTKAEVWKNWQAGKSPGFTKTAKYSADTRAYPIAAVIDTLPPISKHLNQYKSRNNQLLKATTDQIKADIELYTAQFGADRIGIVLGTSTSGTSVAEDSMRHLAEYGDMPEWFSYSQQQLSNGCDFLKHYLQLRGPTLAISTACSSSGNAFATARRLLNTGICDVVIVGGADSLCHMTVQGFAALESLSEEICNPFSKNRQGINIGEGAALFILSREPSDIKLLGVGCSSDAYHISAPDPTSEGAICAINAAINQSGLTINQIDYINLHGTATLLNDSMESSAIFRLFQDTVICSSTKPLTGHTLGAASATELALCMLLMQQSLNKKIRIPPHQWDNQPDSQLPKINLASPSHSQQQVNICMSNSFAFGGNNTTLIIGRTHATQ